MDIFNTTYRGKTIPIAAPSPLMAMTTRLKIEGDLAKYWSLIDASPEDKLPTGEKVRRFRVEGYLGSAPPGTRAVYQSDQSPRGYSKIDTAEISDTAKTLRQRQIENAERRKRLEEAGPLPPNLQALADEVYRLSEMPVTEKRPMYPDPRREAMKFRYFLKQSGDVLDDLDREIDVRLNGLGIDIGKPVYREEVSDKKDQPKTEPAKKLNITQRKKIAQNNPDQPGLLDVIG